MAPAPVVTLIRHGQALHNVDHEYSLPDPVLTKLGESQCATLPTRLRTHQSNLPAPSIIFTSPLKRTIQTTLIGLKPWLDSAKVVALPELQETSGMPCDTGSPVEELEKIWGNGEVDFAALKGQAGEGVGQREEWTSKKGPWAPEPEALAKRAKWIRNYLKSVLDKGDVEHAVCVLHGGVSLNSLCSLFFFLSLAS